LPECSTALGERVAHASIKRRFPLHHRQPKKPFWRRRARIEEPRHALEAQPPVAAPPAEACSSSVTVAKSKSLPSVLLNRVSTNTVRPRRFTMVLSIMNLG